MRCAGARAGLEVKVADQGGVVGCLVFRLGHLVLGVSPNGVGLAAAPRWPPGAALTSVLTRFGGLRPADAAMTLCAAILAIRLLDDSVALPR